MGKKDKERRIMFRCPEELAQRIEEMAESIGLKLSGFIRMVLIEELRRRADEENQRSSGGSATKK